MVIQHISSAGGECGSGREQGKQQEIFGLFVTSLRDQMEKSGKIKINQDELKALTRAGSEPGA